MKKMVYLFELDSVRKTDVEIEIGQKALYDEIVGNGNTVVLTYNQLVDSRGFFSLLDNSKYYSNFITLFENGSIRISQYGDVRTIVQYLINSLAYERSFIYSGWPLKSTQKRLLALIKRSLMYSDLTEINDYLNGVREDNEILDLFVEVDSNQQPILTVLSVQQCKKILEKLFWLLKTVLRLSSIHTIYINPKPDDEYNMSLPKYIHHALSLPPISNQQLWEKAKDIIMSLENMHEGVTKMNDPIFVFDKMEGSTDRSDYHHAIKGLYRLACSKDESPEIMAYQYAEAIVDICYNYQLEYSICNSSKHYNLNEFSFDNPTEWATFTADFFSRLDQVWSVGDYGNRYLLDETNEFDEFRMTNKIPNFTEAVRMTGYVKKKSNGHSNEIHRYEYNIKSQRRKYKSKMMSSIGLKLLFTIICFLIACGLEFGIQTFQNYFDTLGTWNYIIETLAFLGIAEFVTWILSKLIPGFLSLSDAVGGFIRLVVDFFTIWFRKVKTYLNICRQNIDDVECFNEGVHIDFFNSDAMKKYMSMMANHSSPLFRESDVYPIAKVDNSNPEKNTVLKNLSRLEEMFGYRFGVVYKSKFNTMVVDPISTNCPISMNCEKKPYFPYERVVPSSGKDGVVMIPKCKNKFLLIKQYRHAIRAEQYSFPRGYAENDSSPEENAVRELQEELNAASITDIKFLDRVAADSGLTSCKAYVYLIELDKFSANISHEGILEIVALTENEMNKWIHDGKINDGFTLSAWLLFKAKNSQLFRDDNSGEMGK